MALTSREIRELLSSAGLSLIATPRRWRDNGQHEGQSGEHEKDSQKQGNPATLTSARP